MEIVRQFRETVVRKVYRYEVCQILRLGGRETVLLEARHAIAAHDDVIYLRAALSEACGELLDPVARQRQRRDVDALILAVVAVLEARDVVIGELDARHYIVRLARDAGSAIRSAGRRPRS